MCQYKKKSLRNDNESLQEQKDTNNLLYICCHLRSGRHFLSSSRHHTQSVEGEHTQLPGAHSRLYKTYKKKVSAKKYTLFLTVNPAPFTATTVGNSFSDDVTD